MEARGRDKRNVTQVLRPVISWDISTYSTANPRLSVDSVDNIARDFYLQIRNWTVEPCFGYGKYIKLIFQYRILYKNEMLTAFERANIKMCDFNIAI